MDAEVDMNFLFVGLGGAIGSVLRYCISLLITNNNFPYATFFVNFVGSFLMGSLTFYFIEKYQLSPHLISFFKVGLLGGFTTFSSFSLESFNLIEKNLFLAFIYIFSSLVLCLLAIYLSKSLVSNF